MGFQEFEKLMHTNKGLIHLLNEADDSDNDEYIINKLKQKGSQQQLEDVLPEELT